MAQNILIGISGGIAAYKIPQLIRLLKKQGDNVRIVMSEHAHEFVTATTLQAVSGEAVRDALFDPAAEQGMGHIELARWADAYLIAPASANTLGKLAHGIADNLLTTLYLATSARVYIAPAMNCHMLAHPAVQANLATLAAPPGYFVSCQISSLPLPRARTTSSSPATAARKPAATSAPDACPNPKPCCNTSTTPKRKTGATSA